jgi:uncharacterized protein (TIGR00288 family)
MIDFDNVTMGIRSDLQTELKRLLQSDIIRGKVAVQRAYADWRRYPQYIVPLSESSIDLIFAPAYGSSKKNATDIRLAIDALELVFTRPEIGTFILLSGDSDFSSLVLKLKEYGKYVIGVGIRESSSDLLIQNCDEYFSYNELAGLTKESDVEHVRRDPWELVVEAVKQMTAHNDVMRSDRLKQVMQEIDPSFDEKDAGFSRFSKFVQEAAHRGLIVTTRLDNGQYEIGLGQKAEAAWATPGARAGGEAPAAAPEPAPTPAPTPTAAPAARRGSLVGDAFGLLKQALGRLGREEAVSAETVRETMNELAPEGTRRVDSRSMPKLLRQAHDADLIDLSRDESGTYSVRVRPEEQPKQSEAVRAPEEEPEELEPPMPASSAPPPPYSQPTSQFGGMPARSARFRRGSRGPRPATPGATPPRVGVVEVDPNFRPRVEPGPSRPAPQGSGEAAVPGAGRDEDERQRRERGGRGRGGRGRGGRGRNGGEGGESGGGGDRSARGRRGGRGRGGRGRSEERGVERAGQERGPRVEPGAAYRPPSPPASEPAPPPPAPSAAPSRPIPPPAPPQKDEGDSFWSRVKRGLIGGE